MTNDTNHGVQERILVTGGAGFIGSALVSLLMKETGCRVAVLDALTYAGNPENLQEFKDDPRYDFIHADIRDRGAVETVFSRFRPTKVLHLAAESHVDRSIDAPGTFLETNIMGTFTMLEAARKHMASLPPDEADSFRFLHVSTDEVFGDLSPEQPPCGEDAPYNPSSPYSASKAAADHLIRAWHRTYGLPTLLTNCSNNYGPRQFPEKLIPLMILRAVAGKSLPIYGTGMQIRDWIHVEDHARALITAAMHGTPGDTYTIGGDCELTNLEVVTTLCSILDELHPRKDGLPYRSQIEFVQDRPGHDARYALDSSHIRHALGWAPRMTFRDGLRATAEWYLAHEEWCRHIQEGSYRCQRLGLGEVTKEELP